MQAYAAVMTMHSFPRYWVEGLRALQSESEPLRIAFTYGSLQVSHQAFLAPFLGGHLQNHLMYISPDRDGVVVPHHPVYLAKSHFSAAVWMDGLRNARATHVLSLRPLTQELQWMQEDRERFVCLAGQVDDWGLFRVVPPREE